MAGLMTRVVRKVGCKSVWECKLVCACSCHAVDEINVICYSCECDIDKMPTKPNTINLSDRD